MWSIIIVVLELEFRLIIILMRCLKSMVSEGEVLGEREGGREGICGMRG